MKIRFTILLSISLLGLLIAWLLSQNFEEKFKIELSSDPFPMTIGAATLEIAIYDKNGLAIEDAILEVKTQLGHAGAPEIYYYPSQIQNGIYQVPVIWSMMGQATIEVRAELPEQETSIKETFLAFIYVVPLNSDTAEAQENNYQSVSALNTEINANAERELWIVIPQGAQELIMMGVGDEIVPAEIRLSLAGQNTLVIRNDDFVDHTIGPFFIRAGETIRQEFKQAAIFQGTCTLRHNAGVSIIVEES